MIHFVGAGLGFLALAVSCIAVGVAMARRKQTMAAGLSFVSGVCVIAGFFTPALVPAAGPVAGIWFSVVVGWTWLSLTSAHLARATR